MLVFAPKFLRLNILDIHLLEIRHVRIFFSQENLLKVINIQLYHFVEKIFQNIFFAENVKFHNRIRSEAHHELFTLIFEVGDILDLFIPV